MLSVSVSINSSEQIYCYETETSPLPDSTSGLEIFDSCGGNLLNSGSVQDQGQGTSSPFINANGFSKLLQPGEEIYIHRFARNCRAGTFPIYYNINVQCTPSSSSSSSSGGAIPTIQPQDDSYRDLCVRGAVLSANDFDPVTGEPLVQHPREAVGGVAGVKPEAGKCMPMKSTPVNPLTAYETDGKFAFAHYLNLNKAFNLKEIQALGDLYDKQHDKTLAPAMLFDDYSDSTPRARINCTPVLGPTFEFDKDAPQGEQIKKAASFNRARFHNCWEQYVLLRSTRPWFLLETEGNPLVLENDDPVDVAYAYCQPLMSGDDYRAVRKGEKPRREAGMAPVLSSNDPTTNENEALLSAYTRRGIESAFVTGHPYYEGEQYQKIVSPIYPASGAPEANYPCVVRAGETPGGSSSSSSSSSSSGGGSEFCTRGWEDNGEPCEGDGRCFYGHCIKDYGDPQQCFLYDIAPEACEDCTAPPYEETPDTIYSRMVARNIFMALRDNTSYSPGSGPYTLERDYVDWSGFSHTCYAGDFQRCTQECGLPNNYISSSEAAMCMANCLAGGGGPGGGGSCPMTEGQCGEVEGFGNCCVVNGQTECSEWPTDGRTYPCSCTPPAAADGWSWLTGSQTDNATNYYLSGSGEGDPFLQSSPTGNEGGASGGSAPFPTFDSSAGDTGQTPPPGSGAQPAEGGEQTDCRAGLARFVVPPKFNYTAAPVLDQYYCPSVEKINVPGPFTPRDDLPVITFGRGSSSGSSSSSGGEEPGLILSHNGRIVDLRSTDRAYSLATSQDIPRLDAAGNQCIVEKGYTDFTGRSVAEQLANPAVQCAVVPVHVLNERKEAFDNCISQRINTNLNAYLDWLDAKEAAASSSSSSSSSSSGSGSGGSGDSCGDAVLIGHDGTSWNNPPPCNGTAAGACPEYGKWYKYTATENGTASFNLCTGAATGNQYQGTIYTQCGGAPVKQVSGESCSSGDLNTTLSAGQSVYLQVNSTSFSGSSFPAGRYQLTGGFVTGSGGSSGSSSSSSSSGGPVPDVFEPPCATRYNDTDARASASTSGSSGGASGSAWDYCAADLTIQQCCSIITKPVLPANFVKIRTDEDAAEAMANGLVDTPRTEPYLQSPALSQNGNAPEPPQKFRADDEAYAADRRAAAAWMKSILDNGMPRDKHPQEYNFDYWLRDFKYYDPVTDEYIGVYMPYMRWWDTGAAAQMNRKYGSSINTAGSLDYIVGAGREPRAQGDIPEAVNLANEAGADANEKAWLSQPTRREAGNLGGWNELMGEQAKAIKYFSLSCLPNHELLFKPFGAENFALTRGGTHYTNKDGFNAVWPLAWRGYDLGGAFHAGQNEYVYYGDQSTAFPYWPATPPAAATLVGLDKADSGDIIVLDFGDGTPEKSTLRFYYVLQKGSKIPNPAGIQPDFLYVRDWNGGKGPTATGITNELGTGQERILYRGRVDDSEVKKRIAAFAPFAAVLENGEPSAIDPWYFKAAVPDEVWNGARVFRPALDVRACPHPELAGAYQAQVNPVPALMHASTPTIPGNVVQHCINAGYDPPLQWRKNYGVGDTAGPGAGQTTFTNNCPPGPAQKPDGSAVNEYAFDSWGSCPSGTRPNEENTPQPQPVTRGNP